MQNFSVIDFKKLRMSLKNVYGVVLTPATSPVLLYYMISMSLSKIVNSEIKKLSSEKRRELIYFSYLIKFIRKNLIIGRLYLYLRPSPSLLSRKKYPNHHQLTAKTVVILESRIQQAAA